MTGVTAGAVAAATARPPGSRRTSRRRARLSETLVGYSFAAPNLVLLGVFLLYPLGLAAVLSFSRYSGFGTPEWIGIGNYADLLSDAVFWRALANTTVFTIATLVLSLGLGLALAVLLDKPLPGRPVFRTIVYAPIVVSGVASGLIGVLIFDENTGVVDKALIAAGLPAVPWQSNGTAAMVAVILMTVWGRTGFNMVIYLAGLQGIGPELYEAAELEGAGAWQRFRSITFPLLGPSTFFLLIMNVIYSFQVFDLVFVLTGGGPGNATTMLTTFAYSEAFTTRMQGYAAAIGMVLLVLMLAFAGVQWRLNRGRDVTE
ncbi:carbohydrate ABC transporter permease [Amnibacterium kyonggiense]|uniref:Carbohydrate ABC transporter membrane protein 1 (CUT1 family) n=1 Tax=Amnibacterium kyonggiense TaxID=595671 RepID=A0A4R7FIV0_9MICO|nr:sugar ABC transporter permease [Amnibacterium kyonggiense]TDS74812.1 carbohydrate ABC transporter membrane protein 1 (CUT1 family) [Amnibacterium kyonggiense]